MNDYDRLELDRLKYRQSDLVLQVTEFGRRLATFETRLTTAVAEPPPVIEPPVAPPKFEIPPLPATPPPLPPKPPEPVKEPAPILVPKTFATPPPRIEPEPEPAFTALPEPPRAAPRAKKGSFEMKLGTFWLVRIGIVMLLTSLVFFGTYAYQNFIPRLGPGGKVSLLYVVSAALLAIGSRLQRKNASLKNYGQVLQAGGLAAVYFTTYAAHYIKVLQVIANPFVDGLLLLAWAGGVIWFADRKKSEPLALLAVLLGYYTSVITNIGSFTLFSTLLLTAVAVFFLVRNRWAALSFTSVAATYVSYAFWRFFHAGEWAWAAPTENLWTGAYFLMAYWLLFTVAVFLSRYEQFTGTKRAAFLSLNNAAFFSTFALTMLQIHQGTFWKFFLAYGAILTALAPLVQRVIKNDKLAVNAYLIQGLLLITLGFLTRFAGLQLALVLGVESVMLLLLGRQFKSRVMQVGSLITAVLATGWLVVTLEPFNRHGLIAGSAVAVIMLANAFQLRRETTFADSILQPRILAYTVLGLLAAFFTTWRNTPEQWCSLALAIETLAFLLIARLLENRPLQFGAYMFALVAVGWEGIHLGDQLTSHAITDRTGLVPALLIGGIMTVSALWERHLATPKEREQFHPPVSFYSALALFTWLVATVTFTPTPYLAPALALESLLCVVASYPLRLKEFAVIGQSFLMLAQGFWLYDATVNHTSRPWWNPAMIIGVSLAMAAWWPRQKFLQLKSQGSLVLQGIFAFAIVGVLYFWVGPIFTPPAWLAIASVLAIALTVYGVLSRFWLLAAAGQIFLGVSAWEFCRQLADGQPVWYLPLVPIAALGALSFCAIEWFKAHPDAKAELRRPILGLGFAYRLIALAMSLWWVQKYIPVREQIWFTAGLGLICFAVAGWRSNREILLFAAAYTLVSLIQFWCPTAAPIYWPNLAFLLLLAAQQQIAKHFPTRYQVPKPAHSAVIVITSLSLWLFLNRALLQQSGGFYLTVGWSGFALVLFVLGMLLRERVYRWMGLLALGGALGRIVIVDVWKLGALSRIFSFMALGCVLLVLGFLYNKYQDKIKEWL